MLRQERAFNLSAGIGPGADGMPEFMRTSLSLRPMRCSMSRRKRYRLFLISNRIMGEGRCKPSHYKEVTMKRAIVVLTKTGMLCAVIFTLLTCVYGGPLHAADP